MEKRIRDRGYYPVRSRRTRWRAGRPIRPWSTPVSRPRCWHVEALDGPRRRAPAGKGIRCIVSPANDDIFEIDPIIAARDAGRARREQPHRPRRLLAGLDRLGQPDAVEHLPRAARGPSSASGSTGSSRTCPDRRRAIFNFHAPPIGSNLDNAPKIGADMRYVSGGQALIPVGSHAIRDAILEYGPVLSLHGHIHEGRGAVKLGRDPCGEIPARPTRTVSSRPRSSISTSRRRR
jgi:hypothetical protein